MNLNLMMHDVYVYAPLIYYVLFYFSLCAFYEKTKNMNLMTLRLTLMMILKLTLILTLNICMIFYVTFSSHVLSQIFSSGVELALTLKLTLKNFVTFSEVTSSPFLTLKNFVTFS